MIDDRTAILPVDYENIRKSTEALGFTMPSDPLTGTMLRTLAASKSSGHFLELGTGTGLATSWILDGMDSTSSLISIDNDEKLLAVAQEFLGDDNRLKLVHADGGTWINDNREKKFDFIFADTWHGKYLLLDEILGMLKRTGFYIIDDMLPQPNWPDGHDQKVAGLVKYLEDRKDLALVKLNWSTGLIVAAKGKVKSQN